MTGLNTGLTELAPGVRRLVAPNPSMMTGPGTNSYLIGHRQFALIDPGPASASHVDRLIESCPGPIRWVLATHTHPDHSPAAAMINQRTGAQVLGRPAPAGPQQDATFKPDITLDDGQRLKTDEFTLEALHTPGHASNHLCFHHPETGILFTGDHVINGSTVVIDPPDGNMGDYLASLARLEGMRFRALAPGHGGLLTDPQQAFGSLIRHRLAREAKVRSALKDHPGCSVEDLLAPVYPGISAQLISLAARSLLAHLIKLESEGEAKSNGHRWWPAPASTAP